MAEDREKIFHEIFMDYFKKNKVQIASAITSLFPFLEILRDHAIITEKLYNDSQEACRNLVPVSKVVYHILCRLEETFDGSLLEVLFSKCNLKEYPDLLCIHRSFENALEDKQESDREETQSLRSVQPRCEKGCS